MSSNDLAEPFATPQATSKQAHSNMPRRAVIGVAAIGSLLGVGLLLRSVGQGQGGELAVVGLSGLADNCPIETGGTCFIHDCFKHRGDTECTAGSCNCKAGQCAGWDGECSDHPYVKVASGIKIRNAKWPDNYIYVSATYSMRASSDPEDKGTFTAYRVPGHRATASGGWRLILVSEKYPDYAIGTKGSAINSVSVSSTASPNMALEFMSAPCASCDANPLIITNAAQKNLFFYENSWTSGLHTTSSDPGEAGYWYMEPYISQVLAS